MQRVRIGVTGLAAVFLLVLLAAAVIGALHRDQPVRPRTLVPGSQEAPKEPLAELGVAPGNAPPAADTGAAGSTVRPTPAAPARSH